MAPFVPVKLPQPERQLHDGDTQVIEPGKPSTLGDLSPWLLEQTGLYQPDTVQQYTLSPKGVAAIGGALIEVVDPFLDTTKPSVQSTRRIVESLVTDGLEATRKRHTTSSDVKLAEKVRLFGSMVHDICEDVGGQEALRAMILGRLSASTGVAINDEVPVNKLFSDMFVPAPRAVHKAQQDPTQKVEITAVDGSGGARTQSARRRRTAGQTRIADPVRNVDTVVLDGTSEAVMLEDIDDLDITSSLADILKSDGIPLDGFATTLVDKYFREVSRSPLLHAEQEVALAKRIEAGKYAEKILEISANGVNGDVPAEYVEQLVMEAYHGMDKSRMTAYSSGFEEEAKCNPERMWRALDQVEAILRGAASHHVTAAKNADGQVVPLDAHAKDLAAVAADGEAAKQEMIEANLRLVIHHAKRYQAGHMKFLDLVQEGNLGLMHAVEKFDFTLGNKFSTYASYWIRQNIQRGRSNQDHEIRIPIHVREEMDKLSAAEEEILMRTGREARIGELVAELDTDESKIIDLLIHRRRTMSLDSPIGDGDTTFYDRIADGKQEEVSVFDECIELSHIDGLYDVMAQLLPADELAIARMLFGLGNMPMLTPGRVSELLGKTPESIRRSRTRILTKLMHPSSPTRPTLMDAIGKTNDVLSHAETPCKRRSPQEYFRDQRITARSCGVCAVRSLCEDEGVWLSQQVGTKKFAHFGLFGGTTARQRNARYPYVVPDRQKEIDDTQEQDEAMSA